MRRAYRAHVAATPVRRIKGADMYSKTILDHFNHPRNAGVIEAADGIGEAGNPVYGDMMTYYIKVRDNRLEDVKFQTFGCVAARAVSSLVSEMPKGKDLEEAKKITNKLVAEALGGLPPNKLHCSNLGAEAPIHGHFAVIRYSIPGSSSSMANFLRSNITLIL